MPGCPLRNFEDCPEHSKKGGCSWWLSYSRDGQAPIEACAVTLTPVLLLEQANATGEVARAVSHVSAEVSAGRVENVKEAAANRAQLVHLALGNKRLVTVDHSTTKSLEERHGECCPGDGYSV